MRPGTATRCVPPTHHQNPAIKEGSEGSAPQPAAHRCPERAGGQRERERSGGAERGGQAEGTGLRPGAGTHRLGGGGGQEEGEQEEGDAELRHGEAGMGWDEMRSG